MLKVLRQIILQFLVLVLYSLSANALAMSISFFVQLMH
jgi:hypothetical protein